MNIKEQNATLKRVGTIKITDTENNTTEFHATFAAADVLKLLDEGYSPEDILKMMDDAEKVEPEDPLAW